VIGYALASIVGVIGSLADVAADWLLPASAGSAGLIAGPSAVGSTGCVAWGCRLGEDMALGGVAAAAATRGGVAFPDLVAAGSPASGGCFCVAFSLDQAPPKSDAPGELAACGAGPHASHTSKPPDSTSAAAPINPRCGASAWCS
jgi:hypothetical protein